MISDLELSLIPIALSKLSTPGDNSGDPPKDTLHYVLLSLISLSITV
jgi:hypothetical protein